MGKTAILTFLAGLVLGPFAFDQKASAQYIGRNSSQPPSSTITVPKRPVTNTLNGEVLLPSGRNFIGSRDGRVYVPAGPNGGLIDTRGGGYVPAR